MTLKRILLNEIRKTQKITYCVIQLCITLEKVKLEKGKEIRGCFALEEGLFKKGSTGELWA